MKLTLNNEEKRLMKKHHKIKLKLLCPEDYFGHYYIDFDDGELCIKAKKRGLKN